MRGIVDMPKDRFLAEIAETRREERPPYLPGTSSGSWMSQPAWR
jgi:hypothetical protein